MDLKTNILVTVMLHSVDDWGHSIQEKCWIATLDHKKERLRFCAVLGREVAYSELQLVAQCSTPQGQDVAS